MLTSGLRGTAALPWVPPGPMAGSQAAKKIIKNLNFSNSHNREDEGFSAVSVEASGRKKLAASTQRRTIGTSLGLQRHRRKKERWGNRVSSPDARGCPDRDIPPHTVLSHPILKVNYSGWVLPGERRISCCTSHPLLFWQRGPRSVSAQGCARVCGMPGSQGRASAAACVLSQLQAILSPRPLPGTDKFIFHK